MKTEIKSYESMWTFWLDDTCYRIGRGTAYLGIAGECTTDFWKAVMEPEIKHIQAEHNVLIRAVGDDEGVEIQVAQHEWVFAVLDAAKNEMGGIIEHMIFGALLGYASDKIQDFCKELVGQVQPTPQGGE
jgi:hypothetical protein